MQVFLKLDDIPAEFGPSLVSVGNFDGVHRAHAHVLGEIEENLHSCGQWLVLRTALPKSP